MSAASGHEDKGLIECLMVKCAKVLVYCAGDKESYGKDAEAAMALSLGKPVIFYCDQEGKRRFYRDVHPLCRLIQFDSGVAVGAMVTDSLEQVSELLSRLFENRMEYRLEQPKPGYLRLKDALTESVVRIQTSDRLLTETFWNHYHNRDSAATSIRWVERSKFPPPPPAAFVSMKTKICEYRDKTASIQSRRQAIDWRAEVTALLRHGLRETACSSHFISETVGVEAEGDWQTAIAAGRGYLNQLEAALRPDDVK